VYEPGALRAAAGFDYPEIRAVEVAGPGRVQRWSAGQQAMIAAVSGLTGAVAAAASTRIKTFVQIQTADSELFFLHTILPPDELRIHLARGIGAVREARELAAALDDTDQGTDAASVVTELSRLAGLLDSGLLTRPEFDQLKARLLAGQGPASSGCAVRSPHGGDDRDDRGDEREQGDGGAGPGERAGVLRGRSRV
jgi:hypothetical protein